VPTPVKDRRLGWLLAGLVAGVCLSYLWPVERAHAVATDREERFAIATTETGLGQPESVFVLDFLTGRLVGGLLNNQTGTFTNFYLRNVAADFGIGENKPKFVIIPGKADLTSGRGVTSSQGVLYIGELNTGKVLVYRFAWRNSRTELPPVQLELLPTYLSFREVVRDQ